MKTRFAKWFAVSVFAGVMLLALTLPSFGADSANADGIMKRTQKCGSALWQFVVCIPNSNWMTRETLTPTGSELARKPEQCPPKKKHCAMPKSVRQLQNTGIELARKPDQCPPKKKHCAMPKSVRQLQNTGIELARNPDQCPRNFKTCAPTKSMFGS